MGFPDWGLEYNNQIFVKYAESYNAWAQDWTQSLASTLDFAFREGGVHVIDLPVDHGENVKELITDLAEHAPIL